MSVASNDPRAPHTAGEGRLALAANVTRYTLLVLSLYFVVTFVIAAILRMGHPYELEWLEGSVVDQVARVASGESLYVAPSIGYVPYMYTPIYYWLSAAFAKVVGIGFLPLRLTSFLASMGCLFVLYRFVARETRDHYAGLAAAGFYAATYPMLGEWFDMGRSDALGLFFLLLGAERLRAARSAGEHVIAALCFVAAFFTKQVALIVILPLCAHCAVTQRGRLRLVFPAATLIGIALGSGFLIWSTDGWFGYYAFAMPVGHFMTQLEGQREILARGLTGFWTDDLAWALPVPSALALAFAVTLARSRRLADISFYFLLSGGMLATSWSQRMHLGGYYNVLMPAYALVALLAGLALHALPKLAITHEADRANDERSGSTRRHLTAFVVQLLCIGQLATLYYDPRGVIPQEVDRAEGARLVAWMRQVDGEILSPAHGHLPRLAGKQPSAHMVAIYDVMRAGGPVGEGLAEEIRLTLSEQRFAAIFTPLMGFSEALLQHYTLRRMGSVEADLVYPRGAGVGRSRDVYVPRPRPR